MNVDGFLRAEEGSYSAIVNANGGAEVTLSGVVIRPHRPTISDPGDGGFIPINEEAVLVSGADATYRFLDRPRMAVYTDPPRQQWSHPSFPNEPYATLAAYDDNISNQNMVAVVRTPEAKSKETVSALTVPAGGIATGSMTVPGAHPGDLVRLGPPSGLPSGLLAFGIVAAENMVELRLFNATGSSITTSPTDWTVAVSGGPQAGGPQYDASLTP